MIIRHSTHSDHIQEIAKIGKEESLFLSNGYMQYFLSDAQNAIQSIALIAIDDKPIAIGMVSKFNIITQNGMPPIPIVSIFVKDEFRNKGIGSKILKKLKEITKCSFVSASSSDAGRRLFAKYDIPNYTGMGIILQYVI